MADDTLPLLDVPGSTVLHVHRHADAAMAGETLRTDCSRGLFGVEGQLVLFLLDWLADSGARVCARCQASSSTARHYARRIELRRDARQARRTALSGAPEAPSQLLLEV